MLLKAAQYQTHKSKKSSKRQWADLSNLSVPSFLNKAIWFTRICLELSTESSLLLYINLQSYESSIIFVKFFLLKNIISRSVLSGKLEGHMHTDKNMEHPFPPLHHSCSSFSKHLPKRPAVYEAGSCAEEHNLH